MPPKTASPPAPASNQASADSEVADAGRSGEASDKTPAAASGGALGDSFGSGEQALSDAVFSLIGLPFDQLEAQLQALKSANAFCNCFS